MNSKPVQCDVLVIGSGVAGLAAAIKAAKQGLSVIVAEKEQYLGGTTAISAGWAWVPGNKQGVAQGDTREEAETYLRNLAPDTFNEAGVKQFLDTVPETLEFFENETEVKFVYPEKAPDYQMDLPGARMSGRAIIPQDVDARILGDKRLLMQPYMSSYTVFGYMPQVGPDINEFFHVNQSLKSFTYVTRKLLRTWIDTARYKRAVLRSNGNSMMTRMVKSADDLGVRLWVNSPALSLHKNDDGVVDGAALGGVHAGRVHARLGVILAAGGFSGNKELRRQYFPHDPNGDNHFTPTIGHGGDAVTLARKAGGYIDDSVYSVGSWAPVTVFKYLNGRQRLFPHLRAIGLPGLIAVDRDGNRFGNEALSYHDFGGQMLAHMKGQTETSAWVIADAKTMHKYGIGYAKPWPMPRGYFYKTGYLVKGDSLADLAQKIGVDADNLKATIRDFNKGADAGEDPAFGRGSTLYNNFRGDMEHKPNPNLAPLDEGKFYAAKIQMGDLGTFAGLGINDRSEVVTEAGEAVPGLYAVGAAAVSVFGGGYPGYGSHIGPALVFGYRAGRDIAKHAAERGATRI
ncbi:FAD-dependent oxidoreductase [Arthrobacter crystallopoietes]|uniref:Succinate dehydrogenase/fumarate reductase, flavoprotein subunit n=1 Tax=Crystallibacter crystallopoietes TaxID=37928 RepID=A0A1H1ARF7_9MICC|nr:FAD-dependent oxidoreductase [Arthrobacter crystallopoietes]AUI51425.1 dehydrogenase [Arthrobacter crystallopoietes]SDQ42277.1 Succinate dehydrogenase/fumarate reductase, flavoprotein subunit [Arthrobacter crystallopoietes]